MADKIKRQPPPPVEPHTPDCSICGKSTYWDDGFRCDTCRASWSERGLGVDDGYWDDPDVPQCASLDGRYQPGGSRQESAIRYPILAARTPRCMLDAGHSGEHRSDFADTWSTSDDARRCARRVRDLAAVSS